MISILILLALALMVLVICAVDIHLGKRRIQRPDISFSLRADVRTSQQRQAGIEIQRQWDAIRQERGVDQHGRLKRAPRSLAAYELPYAGTVIDIREYAVRRQAG